MHELEALEKTLAEALNRGDAAAAAACYTEDAVLMLPGRPSLEGRAAIEAHFASLLERFTSALSSRVVELEEAGGWAYMRTAVEQTLTPRRQGGPLRVRARAVIIARRGADGAWLYHRDIVCPDQPPAPGGILGRLVGGLLGRRGG